MKRTISRSLISFSVLFFLLSFPSYASSFNGTWSGSGEIVKSDGSVDPCLKADLLIEITNDTFVLNGEIWCSFDARGWNLLTLQIQDGILLEDNNQVGNISDSVIKIQNGMGFTQLEVTSDDILHLVESIPEFGKTFQIRLKR